MGKAEFSEFQAMQQSFLITLRRLKSLYCQEDLNENHTPVQMSSGKDDKWLDEDHLLASLRDCISHELFEKV